jgi:hypothetical protein
MPFLLSIKDYINIDIILNPLKKIEVIEDIFLSQPFLTVSPAFIVYRNVLNKPNPKMRYRPLISKYKDIY